MKWFPRMLLLLVTSPFWLVSESAAQFGPIAIQPTDNPQALANALLSPGNSGLVVQQVSLQGHNSGGAISTGTYTVDGQGTPNTYGLNVPGIVLSTGDAADYASGPNTSSGNATLFGVSASGAQEALLDPITSSGGVNFSHFDVTQLDIQFDVEGDENFVSFFVVFGSEEFPEFVNSEFVDGFGIYLNGQNIALASGRPVNINHPEMTALAGTQLDGVLTPQGLSVMQFTALVQPGSTGNELTFIVADTSDSTLDTTAYVFSLQSSLPPPPLTLSDGAVQEGDSGTRNMVFQVELSEAHLISAEIGGETVQVSFNTEDGTATAGTDYTAVSGVLTFPPGTQTRQISVPILGDTLVEGDETFQVRLSNAIGASFGGQPATGTIIDDDSPGPMTVFASVSDAEVTEGDQGTVNLAFIVSLACPSSQTVTVQYRALNGTARAPGDFALTSGTLVFEPGVLHRTVMVQVNGDVLNEADERVNFQIFSPVNAVLGDSRGVGTILNDDPVTTTLSIGDVTVTEDPSGSTIASFQVTLSPPSGQQVQVKFATQNGSAGAPDDFIGRQGNLVFPAGTTTKPVEVRVLSDALAEGPETFQVNLSDPRNATLADSQGVGTIEDNPGPAVSVVDVALTEGNEGTTLAVFQVSLGSQEAFPVAVAYMTMDGTATVADGDYEATSGQLLFEPGVTTLPVEVPVVGDTVFETDEVFYLKLSPGVGSPQGNVIDEGPAPLVLVRGQATGTILNDDQVTAQLSIDSPSITEPVAGSAQLVFTISLSEASQVPVRVRFDTASGTATEGDDYTRRYGVILFQPGVTSRTMNVSVKGDNIPEPDENFFANLTNPQNAAIQVGQGVGTILNATAENTSPTLIVSDVSVLEGNPAEGDQEATPNKLVFTVQLAFPSSSQVSVNFATQDNSAKAGSDYLATNGTLIFPPGTLTQTVEVTVIGDRLYELNEKVRLNLTAPVNATLARNAALGTILNDDPIPSISIHDGSVIEGNSGSQFLQLQLTLSGPSSRDIRVDFVTGNQSAQAPTDFEARSGTLVFPAMSTTQCVAVVVLGDISVEGDETLRVLLSKANGATILDGEGIGTILNDDGLPGQLDHFTFGPVSSPQMVNNAFNVEITARDRFGGLVQDFNGTVNLGSTSRVLLGPFDLLNSPIHELSAIVGPGNFGYEFTPNTDIVVTHVRHYVGTKVTIWSASGTRLASQAVAGTTGTWQQTALGTPLNLSAGVTYRISILTERMFFRFEAPSTFAHGTFGDSFNGLGDTFPNSPMNFRPFVDLAYSTLGPGPAVPIQPTVSGSFINGVLNQSVTVQQTAHEMTLTASDSDGHLGESNPFSVVAGAQSTQLSGALLSTYPTVAEGPGGAPNFQVFFTPGQGYILECSNDLQTWTPIYTNRNGSAAQIFSSRLQPGSRQFYRALLLPE